MELLADPLPIALRATHSLCPTCLELIPALVRECESAVWLEKTCRDHGPFLVKISSDVDYTRSCMSMTRKGHQWFGPRLESKGCPFDCGPCSNHAAAAGAVVIELTNDCNMPCSTCIASSLMGGQRYITEREFRRSLEQAINLQGRIPILMLSGGEPTIHPAFLDFVAIVQEYKEIHHLMIISNGMRLAEERGFAERLADISRSTEIYLQFDSNDPEVLKTIRGADFSQVRRKALDACHSANLQVTLVCIVNKNLNLHEVGSLVEFAFHENLKGVTFQPLRSTGRHDRFDYAVDGTTLTDVRTALMSQTSLFSDRFLPHPVSPESICVGYLDRESGHAVTDGVLDEQALEQIPSLFWTASTPKIAQESLFRVAIVCLYDRFNFCTEGVKQATIQIASGDGRLIPLDTYYLFYNEDSTLSPKIHGRTSAGDWTTLLAFESRSRASV